MSHIESKQIVGYVQQLSYDIEHAGNVSEKEKSKIYKIYKSNEEYSTDAQNYHIIKTLDLIKNTMKKIDNHTYDVFSLNSYYRYYVNFYDKNFYNHLELNKGQVNFTHKNKINSLNYTLMQSSDSHYYLLLNDLILNIIYRNGKYMISDYYDTTRIIRMILYSELNISLDYDENIINFLSEEINKTIVRHEHKVLKSALLDNTNLYDDLIHLIISYI